MSRRLASLGPILAAVLGAAPVGAEEVVLGGTLKTIHDRGTILIGVRDGAVPFAFRNRAGQPVGFSVDICHGIAAEAAAALAEPLIEPDAPASDTGLRIAYVPVAADARLPKLVAGEIDLECGSTTATAERRKTIAFSPVFFLAGTRLLVRRESAIQSYRTVASIAVSVGTTNDQVVKAIAERSDPPIRIVETASVPEAYGLLSAGDVDAVASDDVLLAGLAATRPDGGDFRIAGDFLSFEPYAIGFRRDDPQFAATVAAGFAHMAADGVLATRYRRWFTDRLPDGETLNLPMSAQLTEMYRALGQPD